MADQTSQVFSIGGSSRCVRDGGGVGWQAMKNTDLSWFIHSAKHFNMVLKFIEESIENEKLHPPSEILAGETIDKPYDYNDPKLGYSFVFTYLSALIVELSIKIIWILENDTNTKLNKYRCHDIRKIFRELQCKTQSEIQEIYDTVKKEIKEKYEINNKIATLDEALNWNKKVIIDYKYNPSSLKDFTKEDLIFVQYGSIWQKENNRYSIKHFPSSPNFSHDLLKFTEKMWREKGMI
ncbi:MAG: hypothetical protein F4X50_03295 [Synechococcus sp. SB0662_bin_14]|nr:hypothetical protein [Synechococcus sp. SB0662_bin_14]MYG46963.1 hypothetical protein [Synechococcus sp. SB0675_bin_6]